MSRLTDEQRAAMRAHTEPLKKKSAAATAVLSLLDEVEELRAALREIRDASPWEGDLADYGCGHDDARIAASDIARRALGDAP